MDGVLPISMSALKTVAFVAVAQAIIASWAKTSSLPAVAAESISGLTKGLTGVSAQQTVGA